MTTHNKEQQEGLRGKLDVHFGDLIRLAGNKSRVTGYVISYDRRTVTLSHENPTSTVGYPARVGFISRMFGTKGNRSYFLHYFSDFEVLRHRDDKQQ